MIHIGCPGTYGIFSGLSNCRINNITSGSGINSFSDNFGIDITLNILYGFAPPSICRALGNLRIHLVLVSMCSFKNVGILG